MLVMFGAEEVGIGLRMKRPLVFSLLLQTILGHLSWRGGGRERERENSFYNLNSSLLGCSDF